LSPSDRSASGSVGPGGGAGSTWPLTARGSRFLTGLAVFDFDSVGTGDLLRGNHGHSDSDCCYPTVTVITVRSKPGCGSLVRWSPMDRTPDTGSSSWPLALGYRPAPS